MMATLSHFPTLFSLSSRKRLAFPLPTLLRPHRHQPTICAASSNKKPRASRKIRSNEELCKDIQEFVSMVGLPEGHVPSLKDLSLHGRQDLANIVRRRGYKLIGELLSTSTKSDLGGFDTEEGSIEKQDETKEAVLLEMDQQDEKVKDVAEDVSSSSESSVVENYLINSGLGFNERSYTSIESSTNASLQEKVANFIQNGELEEVEDNDFGILTKNGAKEGKNFTGMENLTLVESEESSGQMMSGRTLITDQFRPSVSGGDSPRGEHLVSGQLSVENDEDLDDEARKEENQAEISHLKSMLHQKELELSRLKEQIEKEKEALFLLQTKAEKEIGKAQKLISEKDAELLSAEESLAELEEVQIEYWGDGESVEVAGSFNGWHDRVKMEPHPSSTVLDRITKRKSRLWTTVLWLYPGTYEIKFIVDGHWMIDPQRESVTRGTIQNNILQVDR